MAQELTAIYKKLTPGLDKSFIKFTFDFCHVLMSTQNLSSIFCLISSPEKCVLKMESKCLKYKHLKSISNLDLSRFWNLSLFFILCPVHHKSKNAIHQKFHCQVFKSWMDPWGWFFFWLLAVSWFKVLNPDKQGHIHP